MVTAEDVFARMTEDEARDFSGYLSYLYPAKPFLQLSEFLGPKLFLAYMAKFAESKVCGGIIRRKLDIHLKAYTVARLREKYLRAFREKNFSEGGRLERLYRAGIKGLGTAQRTTTALNQASKDLADSRKWRIRLECLEVEQRRKAEERKKDLDNTPVGVETLL